LGGKRESFRGWGDEGKSEKGCKSKREGPPGSRGIGRKLWFLWGAQRKTSPSMNPKRKEGRSSSQGASSIKESIAALGLGGR